MRQTALGVTADRFSVTSDTLLIQVFPPLVFTA